MKNTGGVHAPSHGQEGGSAIDVTSKGWGNGTAKNPNSGPIKGAGGCGSSGTGSKSTKR